MASAPVLIVGAGIAGPAIGIALARARIRSVVYEANRTPRDEAGVFLNLAPNGLAVLRALGVEPALDGIGFQNDRLVFHNEAGRIRGFFGYAVRPSGETYWFSNFVQKEEPPRGSVERVHANQLRQHLMAVHRDDPPEVRRILEAAAPRMAARPGLSHRRCGTRDRATRRPGSLACARRRVRHRKVSARPAGSGRRSACSSGFAVLASSRWSGNRAERGSRRRRPAGWHEGFVTSYCRCS